jgi:hypothetical protein
MNYKLQLLQKKNEKEHGNSWLTKLELEHNSLGIKKINLEVRLEEVRLEEVRLEEGGRKMLAANLGQQALLKLGQQALLKKKKIFTTDRNKYMSDLKKYKKKAENHPK